jgi:Putative DNA-binding domain
VITPASIEIRVSGSQADGARVELNSATYQADARAGTTGEVRLPLPDGLPADAWLYLSRGRQWLDYRAIGDYAARSDLASAGVELEIPEDPDSVIQALVSRGEGLQTEFKSQLPGTSDESKRTIFKTVAAFANGLGGSIVFGVEKDEATICGLPDADLLAERDRLTQLARSLVTPAPDVQARSYQLDGKSLLVLAVERGTDPPYGIVLPGRQNRPIEFYVRRDATSFPARAEEIRNAVLASVPPPITRSRWG